MLQRFPRRRRGFTLIEVMIVVAIVGILAAIAIPNYFQQTLRAKQSEALIIMGSIKTGQLTFSASHGCYAPVNPNPAGPPTAQRRAWTPGGGFAAACTGAPLTFEDLAVNPTGGSVYFQYACNAQLIGINGPTDDFTCSALGDLDGDSQFYELVYCTDTDLDGAGIASPNGTACNFPFEATRVSVSLY